MELSENSTGSEQAYFVADIIGRTGNTAQWAPRWLRRMRPNRVRFYFLAREPSCLASPVFAVRELLNKFAGRLIRRADLLIGPSLVY
jgi:hypothetical protein